VRERANQRSGEWGQQRMGDELYMRRLYAKLGVHRRHEAVERTRALGLAAPPREGPEVLWTVTPPNAAPRI
jgi:hypothetical protein